MCSFLMLIGKHLRLRELAESVKYKTLSIIPNIHISFVWHACNTKEGGRDRMTIPGVHGLANLLIMEPQ